MDDSILIIKHFCHNCNQTIDVTSHDRCGCCDSSFVEELSLPSSNGNTNEKTTANVDEDKESADTVVKPNNVMEKPIECSICLLPMIVTDEEPLTKLKCTHEYHKKCIKTWFTEKNTCPLCRDKVNVSSYVTPRRATTSGDRIYWRDALERGRMMNARVVIEDLFAQRQVRQQRNDGFARPLPERVTHRRPRIATVNGHSRVVDFPSFNQNSYAPNPRGRESSSRPPWQF